MALLLLLLLLMLLLLQLLLLLRLRLWLLVGEGERGSDGLLQALLRSSRPADRRLLPGLAIARFRFRLDVAKLVFHSNLAIQLSA